MDFGCFFAAGGIVAALNYAWRMHVTVALAGCGALQSGVCLRPRARTVSRFGRWRRPSGILAVVGAFGALGQARTSPVSGAAILYGSCLVGGWCVPGLWSGSRCSMGRVPRSPMASRPGCSVRAHLRGVLRSSVPADDAVLRQRWQFQLDVCGYSI